VNLDALRRCNVDSCRTRPDGSTLHAISCRHDNPELMDLIDEVEGLRRKLSSGHRSRLHAQQNSWLVDCEHRCCSWATTLPGSIGHEEASERAVTAHAAHVAALLDGAK
jgi:hypothetical protein